MKITWLGHSAFRLDTAQAVILIDPFLSGGPFKGSVEEATKGVTHVVLTHGHDDHVGDTLDICKRTGAQLIAGYELCVWLGGQGVKNVNPGNTGGTVSGGSFTVTFTQALHSSGTVKDGKSIYLGNPLGVVIKPRGEPSVYHMGDTDVFGDMALIQEMHAPDIGIVPIGDRFTMSPQSAAFACKRFFKFRKAFPCHYMTFPMLVQSADAFVNAMGGVAVALAVGESAEV